MTVYTKITIGGTVFNDNSEMTLKKTTADNNASSRLEATFPNRVGQHLNDFTPGAEVVLYADRNNPPTTALFKGILTQLNYAGKGSNQETVHIMARDYTAVLQKNTIDPTVYTNQEISLIVINLMGSFAPTDFTTVNVQVTGVTLPRIVFKQVNLFDALKQLADLAGNFYFYVDESKDLHFISKSTVSSGVTLSGDTNVVKSTFSTDVDTVKNRVYVYGSKQPVQTPTETFIGTGNGSVFTLNYKPTNTKVQVSGVFKKGDIFNNTQNLTSGADYLVNYEDKRIIFQSGTALGYSSIPGSLVTITVDYSRLRPIVKLAEDQASINAYKKRTIVVVDENINDPQQATKIAKNQLSLNKDPKVEGNLTLQGVVNLTPGQTVMVNLPYEGQNNTTMSVLEASYTFNTKNNFSEQVLQVKLNDRIPNILDVYKDLLNAKKRIEAGQIDSNDTLTRLITSTGSLSVQVPSWNIKKRNINDSFILGHPQNGVMGIINNSLAGSIISGTAWTSGAGIGYNKALQFDGTTGKMQAIARHGGSNAPFSLSAWYALDAGSPNSQPILSTRGTLAFNQNGYAVKAGSSNIALLYHQLSGGGGTTTSFTIPYISLNRWEHVAATFSPTLASLYFNGSLVATASFSGGGVGSSSSPSTFFLSGITVGAGLDGINRFISGAVDDVRLYNRVLTSTEVGSLFLLQNVTGSLIGYWKMDENIGRVAYSSTSGTDYAVQPLLGDRRTYTSIIVSGVT